MKAIILIELDDNHLILQANDLYDRLKGYETELKPLPERKHPTRFDNKPITEYYRDLGFDECLDQITGLK